MIDKKIICILLFFHLILAPPYAYTQSRLPTIKIMAKVQANKILLRFAPTSADLWYLSHQYGYQVERIKLSDNTEGNHGTSDTLVKSLLPFGKEELEYFIGQDERAAVLHEAIYGEARNQTNIQSNDKSQIIRANQEQESIFSLALFVCDLNPKLAEAAGLWFEDLPKTLDKDRYIYRIQLTQKPKNYDYKPGVIVVNLKDSIQQLPVPNQLKADFGDQKVTLSWPTFLHRGVYSAYIIEKSSDGQNFQAISDIPYIYAKQSGIESDQAFFVDSLAENNTTYYYRLKGISPFGETGPNSSIISGRGKPNLSGLISIRQYEVLKNGDIKISWDFPEDKHKHILGYQVLCSNKAQGTYQEVHQKILPPSQTSYQDKPKFNNNYYQIRLIHLDGTENTRSFPYLVQIEDSIPPSIPQNIVGQVDSTGLIQISWKDNSEMDLLGYRVFKANILSEEPTEVTKYILKTPSFIDSVKLNTLSSELHYQIIAVDKNYNTSNYSQVLSLKLPDKVAPVSAIFTASILENDTINLSWTTSPSLDIAEYTLLRKSQDDSLWQKLKSWSPSTLVDSFQDHRGLISGKSYQYQLQVRDRDANINTSFSKSIPFIKKENEPALELKGVVSNNSPIMLSWPMNPEVVKCMVYRGKENKAAILYQVIDGNPGKFTDLEAQLDQTYFYQIRFIFKNNDAVFFSNSIKIKR